MRFVVDLLYSPFLLALTTRIPVPGCQHGMPALENVDPRTFVRIAFAVLGGCEVPNRIWLEIYRSSIILWGGPSVISNVLLATLLVTDLLKRGFENQLNQS